MSNVNNSRAFRLAIRGLQNLILTKPLSISFEITHSCNCDCKHCDKGGNILDEVLAPPKRFGDAIKELNRYYEFFANGSNIPNCKAGYRCLVINPDGKMTPCALQYTLSYNTQKELIENFSKNNTCSKCYVSMRANTERSFTTLIKDSRALFRQIRRNNMLPVAC